MREFLPHTDFIPKIINPRDDMLVMVPRSSTDNVTVRWMDVFVENENALELVHVSKKKQKSQDWF